MAEQGVGDFDVVAWNALYAPKGTPAAIIDKLNAALNRVLERPETRSKLLDLGFEPAGGPPPGCPRSRASRCIAATTVDTVEGGSWLDRPAVTSVWVSWPRSLNSGTGTTVSPFTK